MFILRSEASPPLPLVSFPMYCQTGSVSFSSYAFSASFFTTYLSTIHIYERNYGVAEMCIEVHARISYEP